NPVRSSGGIRPARYRSSSSSLGSPSAGDGTAQRTRMAARSLWNRPVPTSSGPTLLSSIVICKLCDLQSLLRLRPPVLPHAPGNVVRHAEVDHVTDELHRRAGQLVGEERVARLDRHPGLADRTLEVDDQRAAVLA